MSQPVESAEVENPVRTRLNVPYTGMIRALNALHLEIPPSICDGVREKVMTLVDAMELWLLNIQREAIIHSRAKGHGRCWENDLALYRTIGTGNTATNPVPSFREMMLACVDYCCGQTHTPIESVADLKAAIERLP